ncbi:MAG: hypothetical protein DRO00_08830, partial [Thermoproteota archaeon]
MYKKLAVLVAALALIGLMVAPVMAQPYVHEFPQNFINHIMEDYGGTAVTGTIFYENGTPNVAIILGERALPHDVVGATLLGFKVGTHLYYWRAPDVDGSLLGDRYARKFWIDNWNVVLDRYDLLTQVDPLDGSTDIILFTNASPGAWLDDPFEEIYCVDPAVNYWIAPQSIDADGHLHYMVGYHVDTTEMNTAKAAGMVVLSDVLLTLTNAAQQRDSSLTYSFNPAAPPHPAFAGDYDAKTGTAYAAGDSITWTHMGMQFTWPQTPQYLALDVDYVIPWLGYTIMLESITPDTTAAANPIVEFVLKDQPGGMIIDRFSTDVGGVSYLDKLSTTFHRIWYAFDGPSLLKIELDINKDGITEAVLGYFYIEIWDVDYDNDLVRCQFFSTYFAPPIVFEGWVNDPNDLIEGTPLKYNALNPPPAWGDPSWMTTPEVLDVEQANFVDGTAMGWVYVEGIDVPDEDGGAVTDYEDAEEITGGIGADDVAVLMDASTMALKSNDLAVVGEFDLVLVNTDPARPATEERLCAYFVDWWTDFFYDPGVVVSPDNTSDGRIVGWTFYGEDNTPGWAALGLGAEPGDTEEFIWIEANVTWPGCTEFNLPDLPEGTESGDMVFWGPVDCPDGPCEGSAWTFYLHWTDTFQRTDCQVDSYNLYGYDWDGAIVDPALAVAGIGVWPDQYLAGVDLTTWWYTSTLHVYNVTGVHAGIYDSFNCLPGTTFTGTAHVDPVTGAITWGPGGADQYYEGEDVFSFIKTPLAYIDTQVFDGTTLSDDVIDKDLILVGGPHVNSIVDYLNDSGYLYLYYVVDKLFYPADIDPTTGEPNYYDLAYALGLTGMPWPEENIPKYTTGLGAIQFTARWNGKTGPAASWTHSDSDPWGVEIGSVENWILVVAGTDRFGTYAASVALADPTKIIYE